jgi:hypothetical protein
MLERAITARLSALPTIFPSQAPKRPRPKLVLMCLTNSYLLLSHPHTPRSSFYAGRKLETELRSALLALVADGFRLVWSPVMQDGRDGDHWNPAVVANGRWKFDGNVCDGAQRKPDALNYVK